ncbi:MAG: hypothetical protein SGJ27_04725 [Candidatus Melainabacteria bacterium]|nr:hypothetical protein [Candidatus Melainabacteria bacterium]
MANRYFGALVLLLSLAGPALAGDYPKQKYDATYTMTGPQGASEMRMASDGAGKFLTKTKMQGQAYTSIVDYLKMTSTTLIEQSKMAMQTKLPETSKYVGDESSVKKAGGKSLGARVVAGHPCHGWQYTSGGVKSESWLGDDVKIMVQSTTKAPGGTTVMTLKSVGGAPPASAFEIPKGYKMMKTP